MRKVNQHKGRMLILASSLVLVFALGLSSMLAQTNSSDGATPTQQSWQATLTAIAVTKTAYARVYPSPTVNLPDATQAAVQEFAQETMNAMPIDPLFMTATSIVGQATHQAAVELTATSNAIFGISTTTPLPTYTPIPTYTQAELSQQKTAYIDKLVATVGFNHPIFNEMANDLLVEEVLINDYLTLDELELDIRSITFDDSKYVVLTLRYLEHGAAFSRILLFRVNNREPVLLDNPSTISSGLFVYVGLNPFTDVNGNGLPDMPVYTSYGGNCCLPQLHVLEIKPNREIVDIAPETDDVYPARLIDLDDDGVMEIQTQNPSPGLSSWIYMVRWFGWNGDAYVDISRQHPELYLSAINLFEQQMISSETCLNGYSALEIENYLANFYVMGRLSEGWDELRRLLKLRCAPDDIHYSEVLLKEVEDWMNALPKS